MTRILPFRILLLTASAASAVQAQQPDSPARPAADSSRIISCGYTVTEVHIGIPAFTTIQPALSRVAGVQVTPYSGAPGAWATIRIRGATNLTGSSQPLYVVDGVPVYNTDVTPELWAERSSFLQSSNNGNYPNIPTPSTPGANPLLDLPVEDVAQITVLRGAAATAQYGMQGSNGVILITTRQGADGRTTAQPSLRVRYSGWGGVQQVRQRYDLLNGRQYAELANAAAASSFGRPLPYSTADLSSLQEVDWQDELFRPAAVQSHNLSVDGLAHNTRYYAAADYLNQAGVIVKSGMSRGSLRFNLDQQLTQKLSVGLRASASQTDQHYPGQELDAGPLVQRYLLGIPAVPARTSSSYSPPTPRFALDDYSQTARTRRLVTQLNATYQFSPSLSLTARGSREKMDAEGLGYSPNGFGSGAVPVEHTSTSTTTARNWVVAAALRYEHTFREQHAVTAALNYLRQQDQRTLDYTLQSVYGFGSFKSEEKRLAIHSPSVVAGYTYAGRYEVQASMRTEFASGKNANDRKVWLPGGQLSWHINKESFLADQDRLTDLMLWAGSGKTSSFFGFDRTTHHDAGLRAGLLGGLLTLEVAAYQRRTTRAQGAFLVTIPSSSGFSTFYTFPNVTLLNKGLEFTAGGSWRIGPVSGTSQLSAATNHNEVTELKPGDDFIRIVPSSLAVGQPVSRFRVYEADGTFPVGHPSAGQQRYADRNNDGRRDFGDIYDEGTGLPRYSLNFSQQLRLKRFQLDAQFDGLFGYQIQNSLLLRLDAPSGFANSSVRALNYWTPANQATSVPRPGFADFSYPVPTNEDLENGSHVRLSQLSLSYEVLTTDTRKISVWVGGQNLFVTGPYRGFDPNVSSGGAGPYYAGQDSGGYPVARMWQLGLRGQF